MDDDEGGGEGDECSDDEDTAELPAAGPHYGSVPVAPEDSHRDGRHHQPCAGQHESPQGPGVGVVQVQLGGQPTVVRSSLVPDHPLGAPLTLVLRLPVLEVMAELTVPAAPVIETDNQTHVVVIIMS